MKQDSVAKSVLGRFYAKRQPFVLGDGAVTTWESVGAIFLAVLVSRSNLPETISDLTDFPGDFVAATLAVFEEEGWWFDESFAHLTLAVTSADHSRINAELDWLIEEFWARTGTETLALLSELRGEISFGGLRCARLH